jgi:hypothetical protein
MACPMSKDKLHVKLLFKKECAFEYELGNSRRPTFLILKK